MEHNMKPYILVVSCGSMKYIHMETNRDNLARDVLNLRKILRYRYENSGQKGRRRSKIAIYCQALGLE